MRHALRHLEPQCDVNTCVKVHEKVSCEGVLFTHPVGYSGSLSTVNETNCYDAIMFSRNRVNGSERIQVWAHCLFLSCVVVVEPPTASRRDGTGVLWVLTGTHRCDDPPRQGGESSERQLVQCVVALGSCSVDVV